MKELCFYQCFTCNSPYYGGKGGCQLVVDPNAPPIKKEDLTCGSCVAKKAGVGIAECKAHGKDAIEFKCRYCCSVALWFCFGTTHFCEPCHQRAGNPKAVDCLGKDCPLGIEHPANGNEYALGCGLCRHSAVIDEVKNVKGNGPPKKEVKVPIKQKVGNILGGLVRKK